MVSVKVRKAEQTAVPDTVTLLARQGYDPDLRSGGCPVFSGWNNVEAGSFQWRDN